MEVREVFAQNLRTLCDTQPSIASVCREMGINRQQFARYLGGKGLPNTANLEKICNYFGIVEADLFRIEPTSVFDQESNRKHQVGRRVMDVLDQEPEARIAPGSYFVDFTSPLHDNTIVRSLIVLRKQGKFLSFRRLTGVGEKRRSWWARFDGNHEGLVLERRGNFYMIGVNRVGWREPTMLVFRYAPTDRLMLVGHASILGPEGPTVMVAVLSPTPGNMSIRAALRCAKSHSIDAPDIPMDIIDQLAIEREAMQQRPTKFIPLAAT
jgi:transcriptional regulator with XRE-family HTH domain